MSNYMWGTCCECLLHQNKTCKIKSSELKKWAFSGCNFICKRLIPSTQISDTHLKAVCRQGHLFLKLTVCDICFCCLRELFLLSKSWALELYTKGRNCQNYHSRSDLRPEAAYWHHSLHPSITHLLLEIKVPALKPGLLVLNAGAAPLASGRQHRI